jgi:hypothetical protein
MTHREAHLEDNEPTLDDHALDDHVLVVREGHGANCSSIGSVIDTLFATAAVGGALLAAVAAAVRDESAEPRVGAGAGASAGVGAGVGVGVSAGERKEDDT